ncbi:MAG: molybdopterin dinucleotide binding domain-containing protein, partial [Spirillospora sp.]
LSSTDMHPYVHAFSPAIAPPWQARTDFEIFHALARKLGELARGRLGTVHDLVATALQHDTPAETAQPGGRVPGGNGPPRPGVDFPTITVVERDYTTIADRLAALGPLPGTKGMTVKGVHVRTEPEDRWLTSRCGTAENGTARGRPLLDTDVKLCEAILALSGTSNGRIAAEGLRQLDARCGPASGLDALAASVAERRVVFSDTQDRPVQVGTSFEWSGKEAPDRRYSPFTVNTEHRKPWHTLTGRQHFFLDHDWIIEYGEQLPIYRPPLDMAALGESDPARIGEAPRDEKQVAVRYITPHSKWSIHSEYQENLLMQTLARGGPVIWMSVPDAETIGVADNDWIEAVNANGVVVARAIVSHRIPRGAVFMYHVQERLVNVPKAQATGRRGGVHNALTKLLVKPTHLIGGYAQLSFAPNYYGPTGNQRDAVTVIRRRSQEVRY